ncbi:MULTISPECIES: hypothetical protein [unclassified Sinorhizobium]|uniref:hypothetical protein n=1 Tax=unclassified Sinorhizobium TaxID=2613772 RepID=UPI003526954A
MAADPPLSTMFLHFSALPQGYMNALLTVTPGEFCFETALYGSYPSFWGFLGPGLQKENLTRQPPKLVTTMAPVFRNVRPIGYVSDSIRNVDRGHIMKGLAATITSKELARMLASHRSRESDRDDEATPHERSAEIGAGKTDVHANDGKQEAALEPDDFRSNRPEI